MILFNKEKNTALHIPTRCARHSLAWVLCEEGYQVLNELPLTKGCSHHLVMRDPLQRVLSHYRAEKASRQAHFKIWLTSFAPPPQASLCPFPASILRMETLEQDIKKFTPTPLPHLNASPKKQVSPCFSSRVMIRSLYRKDYILGDYE